MDTELKTEWVAALRSGKYEQATGSLVDNGKYCCLGVLCEILVNKGRVEKKINNGYVLYNTVGADDADSAVLPFETAREVFGTIITDVSERLVTNATGIYDYELIRQGSEDDVADGQLTGSLSSDNDRGKTFAEIADLIEAKF